MGWLLSLPGKLKAGLAVAAAIAGALVVMFVKGRRAGIAHMEAEQARKRDALQKEYDAIDSRPVDPRGAYDRLRRMSDNKGRR